MQIDPQKAKTQEEMGEPAEIDQVESRVEAEMKRIEANARERVAQGLQDEEMERDAKRQQEEAERELNKNSG